MRQCCLFKENWLIDSAGFRKDPQRDQNFHHHHHYHRHHHQRVYYWQSTSSTFNIIVHVSQLDQQQWNLLSPFFHIESQSAARTKRLTSHNLGPNVLYCRNWNLKSFPPAYWLRGRRHKENQKNMILTQPSPLPCYMVNNLTSNSLEQCNFMRENDCLEDESTIDYVYLVYCEFGHELRHLSILLIVFLVIILFLALSAIADEFLCPSLLAVAKNLRMSDSLAVSSLSCCAWSSRTIKNIQNSDLLICRAWHF